MNFLEWCEAEIDQMPESVSKADRDRLRKMSVQIATQDPPTFRCPKCLDTLMVSRVDGEGRAYGGQCQQPDCQREIARSCRETVDSTAPARTKMREETQAKPMRHIGDEIPF